jgi:hypothetical protein
VAHLFAADGAAFDYFGSSVAISGDTAIVGAAIDNTSRGTNAGSAYVFVRSGEIWSPQAHLFASDGAAFDEFGLYVAISGDTAVVGIWSDDTVGGMDAGSASVFVRNGDIWTEEAHLFASDGEAGDNFGTPVSISGDTIIVGAPFDDTLAGTDAGSAYVFVRNDGAWTEQAHLFASDGEAFDGFGWAAISGDTAIVTADRDDTPDGTDAGSAYVFVRNGDVWMEEAHLFASDGAADDLFGASVAVADDTVVVGSSADDTRDGIDAGSAYVFVRNAGVWTEQDHLFASDGAAEEYFAIDVSISGDMVAVGTPRDDIQGGINAGSAYVFARNGDVWTVEAHLFASDGAADDRFGFSIEMSDDTIVVGAWLDNTLGGTDAGSAYIFDLDCQPACPTDFDGNGSVTAADLAALLSGWGPNPGHPADVDSNGVINAADLANLLSTWGLCPG